MSCFVPQPYRHLRWHIIRSNHVIHEGGFRGFEVAEWVNDESNGPIEGGHWVRWGTCGDFPSLAQALYVCPVAEEDQGVLNAAKEVSQYDPEQERSSNNS